MQQLHACQPATSVARLHSQRCLSQRPFCSSSQHRRNCFRTSCASHHDPAPQDVPTPHTQRRALLSAGLLAAAAAACTPLRASAQDEQQQAPSASSPQSSPAATEQLQPYTNGRQRYSLGVPASWERKDKAGADVLFEDPTQRSTSVGVTVSPVRVKSIGNFGSLEAVGTKLLDAERKKESTLDVLLLRQSSRSGAAADATLYDYEYEIASTRGTKRILNTVTIWDSKLYILNGAAKCDKEAGCAAPGLSGTLEQLRAVAASFDVGASS